MEEQQRKSYIHRFWGLSAAVIVVFVILGANLWHLQISQGAYYSAMATGNSRQLVTTPATRGDIEDKNGMLLATSEPKFALTLDWMDLQEAENYDWKEVVGRLAEYVQPYWPNQAESVESITEDILWMIQNQQWERYRPVTILNDVPPELQAVIAEHQEELPGVSVDPVPVRSYPQGELAGQVLGFVQEINEQELDQFNNSPEALAAEFEYEQGDLVGKMGVEKSYDYWLRGSEGLVQVEVDNNARPISKQVLSPAKPGNTVQLTIDGELQRVVEDELDRVIADVQKKHPDASGGAAVVIDVNTGEILAMASRPAMNPNELIGPISEQTAEKYFRSEDAAGFNRALSGTYPPGSTFKMITGMAALETGNTTPDEKIPDKMSSLGSASAQSQGVAEWDPRGFGMVDIYRALAKSSNIYFQVMGRRVFESDPEYIRQVANEFGLGVESGVDLPGEAKGIAPSPEWKKAYFSPYYRDQRDKKMAELAAEYDPKIAAAKDEESRQKLIKQKESEEREVEAWYQQALRENVDWKLYDSFNNSIGQGYNSYTPLQLANYVATIVNGGKHMRPHVVDKIVDPVTGEVVKDNQPEVLNTVSISPENLEVVKKGMSEVTSGEGTANWLFRDVPEFSGGGKTGTAQIGSKKTAYEDLYNGMFVAFAPYDNPEIAFAGVVEYGGHGGDTAGYVAKEAFMQYFGWKSTNED